MVAAVLQDGRVSGPPLVAGAALLHTIGALAREFGVTARTLRFYEEAGLLAPVRRGRSRLYTRRDHARLALICRGKRLGFSLNEIKQFLELYEVDPGQGEQMRYLRAQAERRRADLAAQRADIDATLGELERIIGDIDRHLVAAGRQG